MTITTKRGYTYEVRAWTGGDAPPIGWANVAINQDLVLAFFEDQVSECGGLDLWECAGTSAEERAGIFMNRAILDAWSTMQAHLTNSKNVVN